MKQELMNEVEPFEFYEPLPEPKLGDFLSIELFVKAIAGGLNN